MLVPLAAAGCGSPTVEVQTVFAPLDFDYLAKLRLAVGSIDIGDAGLGALSPGDLGFLSPVQPTAALRQMGEQRLFASGGPGRAVFGIDQASLTSIPGLYVGNFAVHLDIVDESGNRVGTMQARVSRSLPATDDGNQAGRRALLYQLTRQLMDDMNVELEFQVRRTLKPYLATGSDASPGGGAVEKQDLAPP